ncbi:hypothetical protein [Dactylosporangium sp. CA-092794]|uniref:hypothetical protein n=1 Tax=Dactylosporangium sp. CA-092794 TaxID=3239929 RepID=UPI003D937096
MAIPMGMGVRDVASPLTAQMLLPPDPDCHYVQFASPLSDPEYRALAEWLERYPTVILRAYGDGTGTDLGFLRHFPNVRAFRADASYRLLTSLDGLRHLPPDLRHLGLGQTAKRLSLAPLSRFTALRRLYLEGQTRDIDVIATLDTLTSLTLRSITLPDLSLLQPLTRLRALDLKLGGTNNLRLLPRIGALQYLELWRIRGLHDLAPVTELPELEHLYLQSLGRVRTLPSFAESAALTRIDLFGMKSVTDLRPLLSAPALTRLTLFDMPQLQPADVAVLAAHPTLRQLSMSLGSPRKNDAAHRLLPLPPVTDHDRHPSLETPNP